MAPPPYSPSETDGASDDDDDEEDGPSSSPLKLTINAAHSIQGSNNLVPTSPTPLADATKFSTILLTAIKQLNTVHELAEGYSRRALKVDLAINCGITVIGDRNVVGNVGLKPKAPAQGVARPAAMVASPSESAVAGAKRKGEEADDDDDDVEQPEVKRIAVGDA